MHPFISFFMPYHGFYCNFDIIFIWMTARYKDDTFHMLETFNQTAKRNTGFGFTA